MWNRIRQWWDAEGALVGLQGQSDRMLADMGLKRDSLRARVAGEAPDWPAEAAPSCACLPADRHAQA